MGIEDEIIGSIPFADKFTQTTGKISVPADGRIDRTDSCKLLWYQWAVEQETPSFPSLFNKVNTEALTPDAALNLTRTFDISNHLSSFTFTKNMNNASGNFEFYLEDSLEWDKYLKPGQWIVAALANNDPTVSVPKESNLQSPPGVEQLANLAKNSIGKLTGAFSGLGEITPSLAPPDLPEFASLPGALIPIRDKIRTMGVISRVGIVSQTDVNGTEIVRYKVTGKDFGTCLEDSQLWLNMASQEHSQLKTFVDLIGPANVQTLDTLLLFWYFIFMAPEMLMPAIGPTANPAKDSATVNRGWLMPYALLNDLGMTPTFNPTNPTKAHFGNLLSVLSEIKPSMFGTGLGTESLQQDNGSMWSKLKSLSQPEFHELFTEIGEDGTPKIFFRPIPWARDKAFYPIIGSAITSWKDLTSSSPFNLDLGKLIGVIAEPFAFVKTVISEAGKGIVGNRVVHRVDVHPSEMIMYDIGPSYEERYNQFIADTATKTVNTETAIAALGVKYKLQFPFRNFVSIKRNGLKPLHLYGIRFFTTGLFSQAYSNVQMNFNDTFIKLNDATKALYGVGSSPSAAFLYEANALIYDYHAKAHNYYSGSIMIAGKNQVKLGKSLVIDASAKKLGNHAFYIEGYTDSFVVNANGTKTWEQTIQVTRGEHISKTGGILDQIANAVDDLGENLEQGSTFHVDSENS